MGQILASRSVAQPLGGPAESENNADATWWCKLLARVIAVFAGIAIFVSGILVCLSVSPICIVSGLLMIGSGIVVLVFEAPMFCMFLEFTKPIAAFSEHRTYFQKAIIYAIMGIIPFALCYGPTSLVGCGLVFAAGVFYGLMGLGKKADREQMMATAATSEMPGARPDDTKAGLIDNQETNQYPSRP